MFSTTHISLSLMLSGEMSAMYPVSGAFSTFGTRFVSPALGFTLGKFKPQIIIKIYIKLIEPQAGTTGYNGEKSQNTNKLLVRSSLSLKVSYDSYVLQLKYFSSSEKFIYTQLHLYSSWIDCMRGDSWILDSTFRSMAMGNYHHCSCFCLPIDPC